MLEWICRFRRSHRDTFGNLQLRPRHPGVCVVALPPGPIRRRLLRVVILGLAVIGSICMSGRGSLATRGPGSTGLGAEADIAMDPGLWCEVTKDPCLCCARLGIAIGKDVVDPNTTVF